MGFTRKQVKQIFEEIEALESYRAQIFTICKKFPQSYPNIIKSKRFVHLYRYIIKNTPLLRNTRYKLSTKIYWVLHNLTDFPICKNEKCQKKLINKNVATVFSNYPQFCNQTCINQSQYHIQHCEETTLKHYNVKHPLQNKSLVKKAQETYFQKTGYIAPGQNPKVKEKAKTTYKEKTGYEHNFQNPDFLKQREKTWLEKYGETNPNKCKSVKDKISQTCLKKYGVKNIFQSDKYRKYCTKAYHYNGFTFDSKPELCFFIWLTDMKIKFEFQPNHKFIYSYKRKQHTYTADFYLIDEKQYIDIKGDHFFKNKNPKLKMVNPFDKSKNGLYNAKYKCMQKNNVKVLTSEHYQQYIDYVYEKYGKNFLKKFISRMNSMRS